jgi:hypothetical protein
MRHHVLLHWKSRGGQKHPHLRAAERAWEPSAHLPDVRERAAGSGDGAADSGQGGRWREDAVKFFDFSKYEGVRGSVGAVSVAAKSREADPFGAAPAAAGYSLKVVSVGAYDASFVPTIADFSRLDARFRLPEGVWAKLPGYADFGFAVFKLKPGNAQVHPMAFSFPTALADTVFFPTLHIHDGEVHAKERFDHTLYLQGASVQPGTRRLARISRAGGHQGQMRTHSRHDPPGPACLQPESCAGNSTTAMSWRKCAPLEPAAHARSHPFRPQPHRMAASGACVCGVVRA